jgi:peptidoglycan/LPS O-acetylase OafA/YrhL
VTTSLQERTDAFKGFFRIDTVVPHRFRTLDGYRAIAALVVVTTHVAYFSGVVVVTAWGHGLSRLDIGVTIFFLLSGFLLFRPWSQAAMRNATWPDTGTYFRRRLWRILPAYLLLVAVVLAVMPGIEVLPKHWLSHLTLTQIYYPKLLINGLTQSWSLATELSFYLVLPLLARWVGRRHRGDVQASTRRQLWLLGACAGVAFVWLLLRTLSPLQNISVVNMWLPGFMDWFAAGMFFAVIHNRLQLPDPPAWMIRVRSLADDVGTCLVVAAGFFLLAATPLAGPYTFGEGSASQAFMRHYLYLLAAVAFLMPGFAGTEGWGTWRRFLASPLMAYLGTISYGIFLWHLFVLESASYLFGIPGFSGWFWLLWPITVVGTVGFAHLSFVLIERPAQRYSHSSRRVRFPRTSRAESPTPLRQEQWQEHIPAEPPPGTQA